MTPRPRQAHLDSDALRCLAHPLRSRLLGALRLYGPATSADLARRLDTNTGATSYHLRRLAEVGLIEEDPDRGTARQRWWRAAHDVTSWAPADFDDDPDDRAAAGWLQDHHARTKDGWVRHWLQHRDEWSQSWREAASLGDMRLRLTPEQARRLETDLYAVIEGHRSAAATPSDPQAESAEVMVLIDIFPTRDLPL